jgi:hypothetical protein
MEEGDTHPRMRLLEYLKTGPLPNVLYHYTNAKGLLGILETNCLWATSARYLSDASEYSYGLNLIGEAVEKRIRETTETKERVYLEVTRNNLREFPGVCVVSLTRQGDLLSQWRGYAGCCGGFSVGLNPGQLRTFADRQDFYLARCVYNVKDQRAAIRDLIDEFHKNATAKHNGPRILGGAASAGRLAVLLKHKSFKEEQEWRLISRPMMVSQLDFRVGTSTLVP